ncbi:hypothetical protein FHL06_11315 [Lactobacillus halodurans]|uniref:Surface layer protein A domain-containing protein n=1 Tax=Companilactobacillus halodurans TaxID=2584183 RepID=A0A5P0ZRN8_9LACO|nr:hypothetical protein [Companilactobacillus halodurans]MQS76930.1 hypothetical protein [Companilactobacillus halodurans]
MKKNIKYAGIAAATLLAVAPIAAPVVSNATTVQATTDPAETEVAYTTADGATDYLGQFRDKTYSTSDTIRTFDLVQGTTYGTNLSTTPTAVFGDSLIEQSKVNSADDTSFADATNPATITSVQAYLSGSKTALSVGDVNKNLSLGNAVTFDIAYSYKTSASSAATTGTKTITFTPATTTTSSTTKAAVTYTTPISVEANSNPVATKLDSSVSNVSIKDQTGAELVGNADQVLSVSPASTYYTTLKDAEKNDGTTGVATIGTDGFAADTTYYQNIVVKSVKSSTLDNYLENQLKDSSDGSYTINGVTYANTNNGTIAAASGDNGATITLTRAINAGSAEAADWTTTANKGVVTTKNDAAYYTLKDDNNDTITNRALAKNTDWATDQKRTNSNGDVQYRVATGEWIDADDVTFSDGSNSGSTTGEYTDVQNINGKVTLDGPSSFIYVLYNDNGEAVTGRMVAGNSEWYTDKKATNASGDTVYRVATGEWVQAGSGVHYSAY